MKTTEIRLGNLVKSTTLRDDIFAKIASIPRDRFGLQVGLDVDGAMLACLPHELIPIPITKETLLMCGFGEVGIYDNVFHIGDVRVYLDKSRTKGLFKYENSSGNVEIEVEYIHQLQNLYFSIVKVELEVIL